MWPGSQHQHHLGTVSEAILGARPHPGPGGGGSRGCLRSPPGGVGGGVQGREGGGGVVWAGAAAQGRKRSCGKATSEGLPGAGAIALGEPGEGQSWRSGPNPPVWPVTGLYSEATGSSWNL